MLFNFTRTTKMVAKARFSLITVLALVLSIAIASAFSVESGNDISMCAGTTSTIIDTIADSGSYIITSSGSASSFSTTIPSGLMDKGSVYSYVSPPTDTLPGVYGLTVSIKSKDNELRELSHKINVTDCHASALKIDADKSSCTCEDAVFLLTLRNSGSYLESYDISAEGPAKQWATLSDSIVIIGPGEERMIKAYVKAPCDVYGKYEVTFKAKAETSLSIATAKANLEILPCYEYSLSAPSEYYDMCDNSKVTIPFTVSNTGTAGNKYTIKLNAPDWAKLENSQVLLAGGEKASVNIILSPPYLTNSNFTLKASVISSLGEVKKDYSIQANVEKCYNALVDISKENDKLCSAVSNTYEVRVKNTGRYKMTYDLSSSKDWAKLSEDTLTLGADEEKIISLDVSPAYNTPADVYAITVTAIDPVSKASASDSINIHVATSAQCYQPSINAKQDNIELSKDSTATDLIIIENKGSENATYIVDLSGTASGFSEINPAIINIAPGKSEVLYLYIAPAMLTNAGDYEATVTVRMKDTTILSSKTVQITVNPAEEKKTAEVTVNNNETITPQKEGVLSKIGQGFAKIGNAISSAAKWAWNLIHSGARDVKHFFENAFSGINPNITSMTVKELNANLTVGELKDNFISGALSENQIRDYFKSLNISDDSVNVLIEQWKNDITENEPIENVTEIAEINETNITVEHAAPEENVTINIMNISVSEIVNAIKNETENAVVISEHRANETESPAVISPVENATVENILENQTNANNITAEIENMTNSLETPKINIDFSKFRHYIIGAVIIILILLLFITGFWKKIIDFFEEEVEEPKKNGNGKKK
jgi:uncharacterized membrane protein